LDFFQYVGALIAEFASLSAQPNVANGATRNKELTTAFQEAGSYRNALHRCSLPVQNSSQAALNVEKDGVR
jgi:hypothetical protein